MNPETMKALADEIIRAVKDYVARAIAPLDARLSGLASASRVGEIETFANNRTAALEARVAELERIIGESKAAPGERWLKAV